MTQHEAILEAFQVRNNQMTLGQMADYSWFFEFRSRKVEINRDDPNYQIRFVKKGDTPSSNLYILERKPKPGDLL